MTQDNTQNNLKSTLPGITEPPHSFHCKQLVSIASLAGLATAFVFVSFPVLDLWISKLFYLGQRQFLLDVYGIGKILRLVFMIFFVAFCLKTLIGLISSLKSNTTSETEESFLGMTFPKWMFLALCLLLGPLLLTNIILKDNWGRARPIQITEFGGSKQFTPVITRSDQCPQNCSFVSGEASSIYATFFALSLLFPAAFRFYFMIGILSGTGAGIVRIAQGGHFMSDVLFAGVFMALLVSLLYWVVFMKYSVYFASHGQAHRLCLRTITHLQDLMKSLTRNTGHTVVHIKTYLETTRSRDTHID